MHSWNSVDNCLFGLFNLAAKSSIPLKQIFFADKQKIDCRTIRQTTDFNTSRMPTENIVLARELLARCYDELNNDMLRSFFLSFYAHNDNQDLIAQLAKLTKQNELLTRETFESYRDKRRTNIIMLVEFYNGDYDSLEYQTRKVRKEIKAIHKEIWDTLEDVLLESGYLMYNTCAARI